MGCPGQQNSFDHFNEMALQQLPPDSLSAWQREVECMESTADAMPVLSSGYKNPVLRQMSALSI